MASAALAFPRLEDVEAGPLDAPPEDSAAFTVALAVDATPSPSPPPAAEQPAARLRSPAHSTAIHVAPRRFGAGG